MRVLAGALLATLAAGPGIPGHGDLAMTVAVHAAAAHACAVVSTATIVAYDASKAPNVTYRFVRSDGTASRTGRLAFAGDGAAAQSVRDEWTPHGTAPWIALEITAPQRIRSNRVAVAPRCSAAVLAATTR
jgi:hypothetical protein